MAATPILSACSSSEDYSQIAADDYESNVALPTTSIVERSIESTTTTTVRTATPAVAGTGTDAALASLVGQLASQPELIALVGQLSSADPAALAEMFQLDPGLTAELGLTLDQVQGLAALVAGLDPVELASALGTGLGTGLGAGAASSFDVSALNELVALAGGLEATALAAVDGISREVIGGLVTALSDALDRVDPALLTLVVALLDHLDPFGLGKLAQDPTTASVLAVFAGAALRAEPAAAADLRVRAAEEPQLIDLIDRLEAVGAAMERDEAVAMTAVASSLDSESLDTLVRIADVLRDPATDDLVDRLRG